MKLPNVIYNAAVFCAAAGILAACSSSPENNSMGIVPSATAPHPLVRAPRGHVKSNPSIQSGEHVLYIYTAYPNYYVEALQYGTWQNLGTFIGGSAASLWVDRAGNVYTEGCCGAAADEYDSSGNLIYTYPGIYETSTSAVTADRLGHVYATGWGTLGYSGWVSEFPQGFSLSVSCTVPNGGGNGIAVDKHGDVFVSLALQSHGAQIIEYRGGLFNSGCTSTTLPISFSAPKALAFDRQQDLVVADAGAHAVDIVAPPYTSITGTLGSGWSEPLDVTINRAGTRAYVTDASAQTVQVLRYPSGSNVVTLPVSYPEAAVGSRNYVP